MAGDFGLESNAFRLEVTQQIVLAPLTYSAWYFSTDGSSPDKILMGGYDASSLTTRILIRQASGTAGDPLLYNSRGPGADVTITSSITPALNTWNHVAVTDSGTAQEMWINGVSAATGTTTTGSRANIDSFSIGAKLAGGTDWAGRIAEPGAWSRVLSDGEIIGLSKGFTPGCYRNGLVAYWDLIRDLLVRPGFGPALTNTGPVTVGVHPPGMIYPTRPQIITVPAAGGGGGTILPQMIQQGLYAGSAA